MSNLKRLRQERRLTQAALARISGVDIRQIQHYEQGFRNINKASAETVYKLSQALLCLMEELLEKEGG